MLKHKLLEISSKDRSPQSISTTNYIIDYNNAPYLQGAKRIVVFSIRVPNVEYNIKEDTFNDFGEGINYGNNRFVFTNGGTQTISIPKGQYTVTSLISAIVADPAAIAVGMSIVLNPITYKLEFTTTTPIIYETFESNGSTMAKTLGIMEQTGLLLSYNAPGFTQLNGNSELYIRSNILSDGTHLINSRLEATSILHVIPVNADFLEYVEYRSYQDKLDDVEYLTSRNGKTLQQLDITLLDDSGRIVDLGGLDWTMTIKVYY